MASINTTPKCVVVRIRNLYFSEKRTPHASVLTVITVLTCGGFPHVGNTKTVMQFLPLDRTS